MNYYFKNATALSGKKINILVHDGLIIGTDNLRGDEETVECGGLIITPSFVDMHVHLRDPGFTYKEDISTACAAAAAGGFSTLLSMPNSNPVCDNTETVKYIKQSGVKHGINILPVAAITKGIEGKELCDFAALKDAGAIGFSDDGKPVEDNRMFRQALEEITSLGLTLFSHCEIESIVAGGIINGGEVSKALGVKGIHRDSEDIQTAQQCEICTETSGRLHICHVSTAGAAAAVKKAKQNGADVTAETAPHYISLTEKELLKKDADFRMNPPLRTNVDKEALCKALKEGTIDVISTDHAPHSIEEKSDFLKAPNGVIGLETSFAVCNTYLVKTGVLTLRELIYMMAVRPRELLGLGSDFLAENTLADFTLVDPEEIWTVTRENTRSKSFNTPFKNKKLTGRVRYTISSGEIIYKK